MLNSLSATGSELSRVPTGVDPPGRPQGISFDAVYRTTIEFVRRVVQLQPIPPGDRDDAVQDVFIVAYRRWSQLESGLSLHGWLHGIAVRTCWNYQRAHRRRNLRFTPSAEGTTEEHPDPNARVVDQELVRDEDLRWLGEAVDRLHDKRREVLILNRIEGKSAMEVSRMTGISPNTVASRLRAALRALREELTVRERALGDYGPSIAPNE
jgi:RNA polymerase sigma-70 factor (ECF subfamily)